MSYSILLLFILIIFACDLKINEIQKNLENDLQVNLATFQEIKEFQYENENYFYYNLKKVANGLETSEEKAKKLCFELEKNPYFKKENCENKVVFFENFVEILDDFIFENKIHGNFVQTRIQKGAYVWR